MVGWGGGSGGGGEELRSRLLGGGACAAGSMGRRCQPADLFHNLRSRENSTFQKAAGPLVRRGSRHRLHGALGPALRRAPPSMPPKPQGPVRPRAGRSAGEGFLTRRPP